MYVLSTFYYPRRITRTATLVQNQSLTGFIP
jgi:hypothetical protein